MSTLIKVRAKKPSARKTGVSASKTRRLVINANLPAITRASALYGLDDAIGAVSIGAPSDKASRRRTLRARIHADNHR
jgi:hypothetical protein